MNIKNTAIGAIAGGIAGGAVANITTANATSILAAGTGLVKTLVTAGAGVLGLGIAVLAALASERNKPIPAPKIPLDSSLVRVETAQRKFWGVVLDSEIAFNCEGNVITAPLSVVNSIVGKYSGPDTIEIETIDESTYLTFLTDSLCTQEMNFVTAVGVQKITLRDICHWNGYGYGLIQGASVRELTILRNNLQEALSHNFNKMINIIGQDTFQQFFKINQFKQLIP